jgi:hypothetical protein
MHRERAAADRASLDLRNALMAAAGDHIDRVLGNAEYPLSEAIGERLDINSTVEGSGRGPLIPLIDSNALSQPLTPDGPPLLRDREAILAIARYRVLPFRLLADLCFADRHASVVTRRMQALHDLGFVTTWQERLSRGGHPRYALLTQKGLTWAMQELAAETVGKPHEQLVRFMLGSRQKKPLILAPNTAPPFLAHQVETNMLATALSRATTHGITWASTWHRPFPNEIRDVAMPQPDAVIVATVEGAPHLIFLEHDRNQESPASFAERKTRRYQLLLDLGLTRELLGFDTFTVLVTVLDPKDHRPLRRIRALQEVSAAAPMFRFTLAGWAHAFSGANHWMTPQTPIASDSHKPGAHGELVGPFHTESPSWATPIDGSSLGRPAADSSP